MLLHLLTLLDILIRSIMPISASRIFPESNATSFRNTKQPVLVIDEIHFNKPSNEHGTVTLSNNLPQWDGLQTDGAIRYLEILVALDTDVGRFYGFDKKRIRRAVIAVIQGLILYLYHLNVRVILVGVHQMVGRNHTLEQFSKYRAEKSAELPNHDVAILMSYGYSGGIAYVDGICGRAAVGITGFFPEAPTEYTAVLFHEIAHLLGLAHSVQTKCSCSGDNDEDGRRNRAGNCLRIDGFDNDCAAQALADKLPKHICIQRAPDELPESAVPICGNQIVEFGEQCDCGLERFCNSFVCNPATCMRTISNLQLNVIALGTVALTVTVLICGHFCTRKQQRRRVYSENNLNTLNIWKTPTFKPLVNNTSKSLETLPQIWTTPHESAEVEISAAFATAQLLYNVERIDHQKSTITPPLPPRQFNYVNLTLPKRPSNNFLDENEILVPQRIAPPPPAPPEKPTVMKSFTTLLQPPPAQPSSTFLGLTPKTRITEAGMPSSTSPVPECSPNNQSSEATIYDLPPLQIDKFPIRPLPKTAPKPPGSQNQLVQESTAPQMVPKTTARPPAEDQNQLLQKSIENKSEPKNSIQRPGIPPPNPPVPPRSRKPI